MFNLEHVKIESSDKMNIHHDVGSIKRKHNEQRLRFESYETRPSRKDIIQMAKWGTVSTIAGTLFAVGSISFLIAALTKLTDSMVLMSFRRDAKSGLCPSGFNNCGEFQDLYKNCYEKGLHDTVANSGSFRNQVHFWEVRAGNNRMKWQADVYNFTKSYLPDGTLNLVAPLYEICKYSFFEGYKAVLDGCKLRNGEDLLENIKNKLFQECFRDILPTSHQNRFENLLKLSLFLAIGVMSFLNIFYITQKYLDIKQNQKLKFDSLPDFNGNINHRLLPKLIKGTIMSYRSLKNQLGTGNDDFHGAIRQLDILIEKGLKDLYDSLLKNGATKLESNRFYEEIKAINNSIRYMAGYEYEKLYLLHRVVKDVDIAENILSKANSDDPIYSKRISEVLRISGYCSDDSLKEKNPFNFHKVSKLLHTLHTQVLPLSQYGKKGRNPARLI